ncbi:hypothetical protein Rhal01_03484 [Rubritalea halochordaticola]|uniref:HTH luxR-type domain-containing protein n=1 Tax=Rubritalea halochordaticola TaxID=714537 RepID=A0ABP9V3Q4_9BACT
MSDIRKYLQGPDKVRLSHEQWASLNEVILDISASTSADDLMKIAAEVLPGVLKADWAAWNEHDQDIQLQKVYLSPGYQESVGGFQDLINHHMETHPVVQGMGLIGKEGIFRHVWSLTDFTPEADLHKVAIWAEAYRHMGAQHQLSAQFCTDGQNGVILTVNSAKAFSEEQRMMVRVLREHFELACRKLGIMQPLRAAGGGLPSLSNREREVLLYVLDGKTNPEIAIIMGISSRTVEKHVARLLDEFQVENRLALMAMLLRRR